MNRRTTLAAALALTAALGLAGCGGDTAPQLKVDDAYMPQPVTQDMAGAFFTIKNSGAADKLTGVTTNLAKDVTIHKTVGTKMEQVDSLAIPADGELRLDRGGNHLMLMGLKHKPTKGDTIGVQLHFANAQPINVDIPVRAVNYAPQKK